MLRTLGASRRQVLRAVSAEALVIGLISSLLGLAGGYLVAAGINAAFRAFGIGIPTTSPSLAVRTVVLALIVGVGVTLLASIGPARRATKIPPIAALREGAVLPRGRFARYIPLFAACHRPHRGAPDRAGILRLGLGLAAGCSAWASARCSCSSPSRCSRASSSVPVTRVLGWPLERLAGTTGRLARENAMRNPARTARTAAALMIGLGLIVFVAVFTQGLKDGFRATVVGSLRGNVVAQSSTFLPMPAGRHEGDRAGSGHGDRLAAHRRSRAPRRGRHALDPVDRSGDVRQGLGPQAGSRDRTRPTARSARSGVVVDTDVAKSEHLHRQPVHPRDARGQARELRRCAAPTTPTTRRSAGS